MLGDTSRIVFDTFDSIHYLACLKDGSLYLVEEKIKASLEIRKFARYSLSIDNHQF
jgi:hypothetical protein